MRKHSLMKPKYTLSALALAAAMLGGVACSDYDGTDRWEGVYKPESEIDRPKGGAMMTMDAGRPDGGAADGATADGATADGATNGDAAAAEAGTGGDAASDAANGDAMTGDAMTGDAAPADATPAG